MDLEIVRCHLTMNTHSVNGIELAAVDRGRGTPLLLVHGFPLDHSMWDAQIDSLAATLPRDRTRPARLRPERPDEGKVTMEQFADDWPAVGRRRDRRAGGLLRVVDGRLRRVGVLAAYSDRVRALVLCDTRAAADTPEVAAGRLKTAQRVQRDGAAALVEGMIAQAAGRRDALRAAGAGRVDAGVMLRTDPRGIAAAPRGMAERGASAACFRRSTARRWWSSAGTTRYRPWRRCSDRRSDSRRATGGDRRRRHMSPLENPAEVNAAIREFLASLD